MKIKRVVEFVVILPKNIKESCLSDLCETIQNNDGCNGTSCNTCPFMDTKTWNSFESYVNGEG